MSKARSERFRENGPARHWYRDRGISTRIFAISAALMLGTLAATVAGIHGTQRVGDLHEQSTYLYASTGTASPVAGSGVSPMTSG